MRALENTERNDRIVQHYRRTGSLRVTAELVGGISHERVRQIVARAGALKLSRVQAKRVEAVTRLHAQGKSLAEMAKALKCSEGTARLAVRCAGLEMGPHGNRARLAKAQAT